VPKIIKVNLHLLKLFSKKCRLFFSGHGVLQYGWLGWLAGQLADQLAGWTNDHVVFEGSIKTA